MLCFGVKLCLKQDYTNIVLAERKDYNCFHLPSPLRIFQFKDLVHGFNQLDSTKDGYLNQQEIEGISLNSVDQDLDGELLRYFQKVHDDTKGYIVDHKNPHQIKIHLCIIIS